MKHTALHSIAHNVADSLGSGYSLLTGVYDFDLFKELVGVGGGEIQVDMLTGLVSANQPSSDLLEAARRVPAVLADLCMREGGSSGDFKRASARFWLDSLGKKRFDVTVGDIRGRQSTLEYRGWPGKRLKILDPLGRLRPKRAEYSNVKNPTHL